MCICLVQMEAVTFIVLSFLWILYRSCLEYCKYQREKYLGGRKGITNRVCLCYFCAENCSWMAYIGCPGPPPVSFGSTKAIKERWWELCFALYPLRVSGLTLLDITLAARAHERGTAVTGWVETMHHRDGGFLVHLVGASSQAIHTLTLNSSYGRLAAALPSAALYFVCWLVIWCMWAGRNNLIS